MYGESPLTHPLSPGSPTSHMSTLGAIYALSAMEAGLRRALETHCFAHLFTLYTFFTSSEEQEFMRERVCRFEIESRNMLKLEEMEDVERTARFDILFDCEVDWETLTGRLGAESFSLVTRTVLEGMETRQFLALALDVCQEREYVHRCNIMAEGLRPGFVREQNKMIKGAMETVFASEREELLCREELVRDFVSRMPQLTGFFLQREELEEVEGLRRTAEIEEPFDRWVVVTKKIRDEFAFFWTARVIEYHLHLAEAEEELYCDVLLQEEDATRSYELIPSVVGGLESAWRQESVLDEEQRAWNEIELAALQSLENAERVDFLEFFQRCYRNRLRVEMEHSAVTAGQIYPEWQEENAALVEDFGNLIRCALISQRFALESVAVGSRRTIVQQWAASAFSTAVAACVLEEEISRVEEEAPINDECALFQIEAEELHGRHTRVLYPQLESVFVRVFRRAVIHEETTARNHIIDVEWENGVVALYSAFHLLWLETVTMGVTRNATVREWERETMVLWEVWVRMGAAAEHAHALEADITAQIVDFMPDFWERAAPIAEEGEDEEEQGEETDAASADGSSPTKKQQQQRQHQQKNRGRGKLRAKDPDALPDVFYIGEDPFSGDGDDNEDKRNRNSKKGKEQQQQIHTPAPPKLEMTPGVVIRYRAAPRQQQTNDSILSGSSTNLFGGSLSSTRGGGGGGRSLFVSPNVHAAQGSHFIMPDSVDVTSIRASIKELGRIRGGSLLLLAMFFQITLREQLTARYDEWLASYGDMGYWAHAIEVGLLEQLTSLDNNFVEDADKAKRKAIAYNSVDGATADRQLAVFVRDRSGRIDNNNSPSRGGGGGGGIAGGEDGNGNNNSRCHSPVSAASSTSPSRYRSGGGTLSPPPPLSRNKRHRTVIDALRESLRRPPRPSQRKVKNIPLTYHPEMMEPVPKASFNEWSPSRMTPDEFALLEHTMILRTSGVEAQKSKDVFKKRHGIEDDQVKQQQQQRVSPSRKNNNSPRSRSRQRQQQQRDLLKEQSTALPLEKGKDAAWNIYVAAASRASQREHDKEVHQQHQQARGRQRASPERSAAAAAAHNKNNSSTNSYDQQKSSSDVQSPLRPGSRVRFHDEEQQQQNTSSTRPTSRAGGVTGDIPRLAPSRLGDYDEDGQQQQKQRPGSATVQRGYSSQQPQQRNSAAASSLHHSAPATSRRARPAAAVDPDVEDRKLQFSDLFDDKKNQRQQQQQQAGRQSSGGGAGAVDQHLLHEYSKVVRRTSAMQSTTSSMTSAFIASQLRPISVMVKPTPPKSGTASRRF